MLEIVRTFNHSSVEVINRISDKFRTRLHYNSHVCSNFPLYYGCNNDTYLSTECNNFVVHVDMNTSFVYIDPGTKMKEVPGLVYSHLHSFPIFKTGHHNAKNTWIPNVNSKIPIISHKFSLGTIVQEYPCSHAHFIREALPRFV